MLREALNGAGDMVQNCEVRGKTGEPLPEECSRFPRKIRKTAMKPEQMGNIYCGYKQEWGWN